MYTSTHETPKCTMSTKLCKMGEVKSQRKEVLIIGDERLEKSGWAKFKES